MKRILFALVLLVSVAGCEVARTLGMPAVKKERPTVNVPAALRQSNWRGPQGQGSCVHASMISLFRWQYRLQDGRLLAADLRRRRVAGRPGREVRPRGHPVRLRRPTETCGSWNGRAARGEAAASRSWAGRTWSHLSISTTSGPRSSTTTTSSKFIWVPRETLIAEWKASYGWAVTPIYTPAAPLPQ